MISSRRPPQGEGRIDPDVHLDARTSRSKSPAAKLANRIVTLRDGLKKTSYAISTDETRYVLNGIFTSFRDGNNEIYIIEHVAGDAAELPAVGHGGWSDRVERLVGGGAAIEEAGLLRAARPA